MQKDIKFEGSNGTKKSAVKHFWAYCAILFCSALVLIMMAGYIQTKTLTKLQQENNTQVDVINNNESALKNIQAMYEDQKKTYEKLQKNYEVLLEDTKKTHEQLEDLRKETEQINQIAAIQNLYIKNQKVQARKDFVLIKSEEIKSETVLDLYETLRIKLGIKAKSAT